MKTTTLRASRRRIWPEVALVTVLSLIGIALVQISIKSESDSWQLAVLLLGAVPAYILAIIDSPALVAYVASVFAFAPGLRRITDFQVGAYNSISLISILPLLASLAFLIPIVRYPVHVSSTVGNIAKVIAAILGFGLVVGMLKNGTAALLDFADYMVPLLTVGFCVAKRPTPSQCDSILRSFVVIGVLVSLYGWVQYTIVPQWDSFFMQSVNHVSAFGEPFPYKVRMFSTLNSAGSCSQFLILCLASSILDRRWRGPLGVAGTLIILSGISITFVRTAWIVSLLMILVFAFVERRSNPWKTILSLVAVIVAAAVLMPLVPGGNHIADRLATFQKGSSDHSIQERTKFSAGILVETVKAPFGFGLGSTGTSSKLNNGGQLGNLGIFDNGYLNLAYTFGLLLALAFVGMLFLLVRSALRDIQLATASTSRFARLAAASLVCSLVQLVIGNCFIGVAGFVVWLPVALWLGTTLSAQDVSAEVEVLA